MANDSDHSDVLIDDEGGIRTVILNRPERMNAFSFAMREGIEAALLDFHRRDDLRVLVLTGAGRGFCAGADLVDGSNLGPKETIWERTRDRWWYYRAFDMVEKPTICALNGAVAGGGMGLMLACDVIVASSAAKIVPAFSRVGISPDNAVGKNLPQRIGYNRALLFLLLGESVPAEQALEWGLVDRVYEPDTFEAGVAGLASALAAVPPVTASLTKRLLRDAPALPTHVVTSYEQLLVALATASGEGAAAREALSTRLSTGVDRGARQSGG